MEAQAAEHTAKLASLDRQSAQKDAERREAEASIAKIEATLPILRSQRDIRERVLQNEFGSRLLYLQAQQEVVDQEHELVVQRHKREEIGEAASFISGDFFNEAKPNDREMPFIFNVRQNIEAARKSSPLKGRLAKEMVPARLIPVDRGTFPVVCTL